MATLATVADLRNHCNLAGVVDEALLTPHLELAEAQIRERLGETQWAAVATPSSPYQAADKARLQMAEALLAGALATPILNVATSGQGIVTAQAVGGGGETRFLSEGQAKQRAQGLADRAERLLARYLPGETDDDRATNVTGGMDLGDVRLSWL